MTEIEPSTKEWGTWMYHAEGTNNGGGAGNITLTIKPEVGSRIQLDTVRFGQDDYAAGRTLYLAIKDENDADVTAIYSAAIDNEIISLPAGLEETHLPTATNQVGSNWWLTNRLVVGPDYIWIYAYQLAAAETFEVMVRCQVKHGKPALSWLLGAVAMVEGTNLDTTINKVV